jgi:hypothetical protein
VTPGSRKKLRKASLRSLLVVGVISGATVAGSASASAASQAVLHVSTTGSGSICSENVPCGSIQSAVDTATGGHYAGADVTIVVAPGTYDESDSIGASTLNSLTVTGTGATTITDNRSGPVLNVNSGTVTLSGLTITNGAGSLSGGGGGGIRNSGALTIDNSIVSNDIAAPVGSAASGGGIYNSGGTLTVTNSTLSGNSSSSGGGIYNSGGTLTVTNSTLSGNSAASGGGIYNSGGTLTVTNSTLSGNSSPSGGGIYNSGGTLTVTNSTLSGNSSSSGGGIYNSGGGTTSVAATVLANGPSGGNCGSIAGVGIINGGYNLADDATCGNIPSSTALDASLGALADHGGPTLTLLPALGSPAIGAIPPGAMSSAVPLCPRTDQRGVPSAGNCTIGAVEGGFRIDTTTLPAVTPGSPYGPVQLAIQEVGVSAGSYVTKLRWKKVSVPKGLKLSQSGVLSGKPSKKLLAGPTSVVVLVSEKVKTVNVDEQLVVTVTNVQVAIPTFINVAKSAANSATQSNLQTAVTAARTYYTQNGQSFSGLDPTTFAAIDTGLTAVGGSTASNGPKTVSISSSSNYVVLAAWSNASTCWSIIDIVDSTTLEGYAGPVTIYLTSPAVTEAECSAATFNSASAISGAVISWNGFPKT